MENGPHTEAEFLEDDEDDDEELPSANSPSEEVGEDDEEEEPLQKRQRRKAGESTSASSPLKDVAVEDKEETSGSSSGDKHTTGQVEPLVVPPLNSAPPTAFARMPSPSLGSEDDVTRSVL